MILSMTGFGRGTAVRNGREITVELRSVNSRYFEYSSRIPRTCSYLDSRLKKQLNERISRGKVELSMTVQNVDAADTVVAVNMELARSYQQAMRDISEQLGVKNDISAGVLTRFPDVLTPATRMWTRNSCGKMFLPLPHRRWTALWRCAPSRVPR